jgi:hypothetical protein
MLSIYSDFHQCVEFWATRILKSWVYVRSRCVYIICLSVFCYHVRWPNFPSKEFDCMVEAFSISERTVKKMSEELIYGKLKTSFTMFSDVKYQNVSIFFSETLKNLGNGVMQSYRRRK